MTTQLTVAPDGSVLAHDGTPVGDTIETYVPHTAAARIVLHDAQIHQPCRITVVWSTRKHRCHPNTLGHQIPADRLPALWDKTQMGDWASAEGIQCTACGARGWGPILSVYNRHLTDEEIRAHAAEVAADTEEDPDVVPLDDDEDDY